MKTRIDPAKYAIEGAWRHRADRHGLIETATEVKPAVISVKVADLLEKGLGHLWPEGAYKVQLTNVPGMRTKTFYGETAWSDAERYASDAALKCGWIWSPGL